MLGSTSIRLIENREQRQRKNICILDTTCTQRKRREEEEGVNKVYKIEKPDVQGECFRKKQKQKNRCEDRNIFLCEKISVYAGNLTHDLSVRS